MDIIITPQVVPVRRAMPGLSPEDRKRLAVALAESKSLRQAADAYGVDRARLVELAKREGFGSLLRDLRHPLMVAMQDKVQRDRLVQMIREGVKPGLIAQTFHTTRAAVWAYFYRTGLDVPYMRARQERRRSDRQCSGTPTFNTKHVLLFQVAALLASRGIEVSGAPTSWHSQYRVNGFELRANGRQVRLSRVQPLSPSVYHRLRPSISDAWYVVVLPGEYAMAYAPPHHGQDIYIPVRDPFRVVEGRRPPFSTWDASEWPSPESLGFKAPKRRRAR